MKIVLIILAICVGFALTAYIPWLVGGAAAVIFCFWMDWHVAGVIIGLFCIFLQVVVGTSFLDESADYSDDDTDEDGGLGFPEMFIGYKMGERHGRKKDD